MNRLNISYICSIFLIILLVNQSSALGSVDHGSKENKDTVDGIEDSKVAGWMPGVRGFPWVGPGGHQEGGAFPWVGPGGHQGPAGGWYPWGWFPWGGGAGGNGGGSGGKGGGSGGGEGGAGGTPGTPGGNWFPWGRRGGQGGFPGGMPGTPGWFPWGGRGGNGGGSGGGKGGDGGGGGSPGAPGGPHCGGNGGGPGGGAGGCGGNGGGSGGGRGGKWVPPQTGTQNPGNALCGNMQIIPGPSGYTISYDCGNCKYQYTVDNNGMATGGSGSCS